jgi:YebC/PmpR family DNA-binding regulatory protein
VPNDNISRILKKLSGDGKDAAIYSEQVYEGFGPEGIPFVITALTDNIKRTFPAVKTAFAKNGGTLGSSGSVMFMFNHVGVITIKNEDKTEDELFELAIEAGADDFSYNKDGESEIITKFAELGNVVKALEGTAEIVKFAPEYRAKDPKIISDEKLLEKIEKFIDAVEDVDDVDDVFGGFDIDDSLV